MFYLQFAIIIASLFSSFKKISSCETDNAFITRDKCNVLKRKRKDIFLLSKKFISITFHIHYFLVEMVNGICILENNHNKHLHFVFDFAISKLLLRGCIPKDVL